jgi:hypothetical protein
MMNVGLRIKKLCPLTSHRKILWELNQCFQCRPDSKRKKEGEQEQRQADKEQAQDDKKVAEKPEDENHKGNGKASSAQGDKDADQEKGEGDEEQHAKKQKTVHHSEQPEHPGTHRKSVADVAKLHEEQGIERPKAKERLELLKKMQTLEDMKEVCCARLLSLCNTCYLIRFRVLLVSVDF